MKPVKVKKEQSQQFLAAKWKDYRLDPVKFCYEVAQVKKLDTWQREVLMDLARHDLVAVAAGTGVGKDYLASLAIVWFLCCFPHSKVSATSASSQQLQVSLWMELQKVITESAFLPSILEWSPSTVQVRGYGERWRAFQSVAAKRISNITGEAQAEGGAGQHAEFLLLVISEASGVEVAQFDAKLATLTGGIGRNICLVIGNPVRRSGRFYDIFTKAEFKKHWITRHVDQRESSFVSHEATMRLVDMHGEDSALVQAKVHGQFPMLAEGKTIFGYDEVEKAFDRDVEDDVLLPIQIGVDVARYGNSESVIATRRGDRVLSIEPYKRIDLMRTTSYTIGEAIRWWRRGWNNPRGPDETLTPLEIKDCQDDVMICVDEVGIGGGVIDALVNQGWNAVGINNGSKAWNPMHYNSRGDELWFVDGKIAISRMHLPRDEELQVQLCNREVRYDRSSTKRRVESKDELLRRGLPSPDRADALLLAFAAVTSQRDQNYSRAIRFT